VNHKAFFKTFLTPSFILSDTLNSRDDIFDARESADKRTFLGNECDSIFYTYRAFRWTEEEGQHFLGTLNGLRNSYAKAMSADGQVILGYAWDYITNPDSDYASRVFIWYNELGMMSLHKALTRNGALTNILSLYNTRESCYDTSILSYYISNDGTIVVGQRQNFTLEEGISTFYWSAYIPRYDVLAREGINLLKQ
jgi:hypothetical protein